MATQNRLKSRPCARVGCKRTVASSAPTSAKYCSPSCRTLACRQRKKATSVGKDLVVDVSSAKGGVNRTEADTPVNGSIGVNRLASVPSLKDWPFTVLTEQVDGLRQGLRDVVSGQQTAVLEAERLRLVIEQTVLGGLLQQQEQLSVLGGRLATVERERDQLLAQLHAYFHQQESRLRAESELHREKDRLHRENQELRATLDALKRQLSQRSVDNPSLRRQNERRSDDHPAREFTARSQPLDDALSMVQRTHMRLLPATLPDAPPMEEWPLESPTERDYWKHWLVPVIWPALSEMTKELPLTSPEQAAMAASEMMPIAVVAAQLYLGTLLQRSQPALPSVTKLSESVISSLRKMPLVYPPNYVEQLSKQPGPLKLATAIAIEAIHKRLQSLIAELSSRKA